MLDNVYRWADRGATLLASIAGVVAALMAGFVVLAVVMRYLFGSPFGFTEELAGLLFLVLVFAGLPVCTLRRSHLAVTIVPEQFTGWRRAMIERVSYALILLFCIWFGLLTWDYMQSMVDLNARTSGSRLLLWPWTAALPASAFLSGAAALLRLIAPTLPVLDHDNEEYGTY